MTITLSHSGHCLRHLIRDVSHVAGILYNCFYLNSFRDSYNSNGEDYFFFVGSLQNINLKVVLEYLSVLIMMLLNLSFC